MIQSAGTSHEELERLSARVQALEHERRHLLAVIEILEEIGGSLHFADIVQSIAKKLGEAFGLDRCAIYLSERGGQTVRLVASFEDPSIRNYVVDLDRYPELKRAIHSGQTVFIPDAVNDPTLRHVRGALTHRRVKSITVVPITWRGTPIGAIFLRTFRDGPSFSDVDVKFCQVVASLTAKALRNAHRFERLQSRRGEDGPGATRIGSGSPCSGSSAGCSRPTPRRKARGRRASWAAPRPRSSTAWWAWRGPCWRRRRPGGDASGPRGRAAPADRPRQHRLLRARRARDLGRGIRPAVPGAPAPSRRSTRNWPPPTAPPSGSAPSPPPRSASTPTSARCSPSPTPSATTS